MEFLKTRGRLVYDPVRSDLKKTHKSRTLVAELPWDDLDLYYQWFLRKQFGTWFDHELRAQTIFNSAQTAFHKINENTPGINRPMWGKHVTIVRGDEPGFKSKNWKKHEGEMIDIYYSPIVSQKWKFWSLPVKSDNLSFYRAELGLGPIHNFHITVAREHE